MCGSSQGAWQGWRVLISLICSLRPSYNIQIRRSAPLCTARQATTRPDHNFVAANTTRHATSQVVIHNHYKHDIHTICSSKHNRARYNTKKTITCVPAAQYSKLLEMISSFRHKILYQQEPILGLDSPKDKVTTFYAYQPTI